MSHCNLERLALKNVMKAYTKLETVML